MKGISPNGATPDNALQGMAQGVASACFICAF